MACGPDPEEHAAAIQAYVDAGFDEIYVGQIGPDHDGFVDFYAREILPRFTGAAARTARRSVRRDPRRGLPKQR